MTDISTSLLMVGPTGVGPFNSGDWRVGATLQLVEGSNNGPYWLFTDTLGQERVLMIDSLFPEVVTSSIVLALAVATDNEKALSILEASHNIVRTGDGKIQVAPYWDLADEVTSQVASTIVPFARLGFVVLDESSIASDVVFAHLLSLGFRLDVFVSKARTVDDS